MKLWPSVFLVATTALAVLGWLHYAEGRKGSVWFWSGGDHVPVEVESVATGELVGAFQTPTGLPLRLDPGDYRVRVTPERRLGQTLRLHIPPGSVGHVELPPPAEPLFEVEGHFRDSTLMTVPGSLGAIDLLAYDRESGRVRRYDGKTGGLLWDSDDPDEPKPPAGKPSDPPGISDDARLAGPQVSTIGLGQARGFGAILLAPKQVDLDGDTVGDALWADTDTNVVVAQSGKGPGVLWRRNSRVVPELKDKPPASLQRAVIVQPEGGPPIVVAAFRAGGDRSGQAGDAYIQALAGKTGEPLWTYKVAADGTDDVPGSLWIEPARRWGRDVLAVASGKSIHFLDPKSGPPLEPPLAFRTPVGPDAIFSGAVDGSREDILIPGDIVSPPVRYLSRETSGTTVSREFPGVASYKPAWALDRLADLDGDGMAELILFQDLAVPNASGRSEILVVDGKTHQDRWRIPLVTHGNSYYSVYALTDLDIDGDGTRDVITSWAVYNQGKMIHALTAFSGRDGARLWDASLPGMPISQPTAWGRGPDGRPMILAVLDMGTVLIDPRNGREFARIPGAELSHTDDLDGDGHADLWGLSARGLLAIKNMPMPAWQRTGDWIVTADLDRDGVTDLIGTDFSYGAHETFGANLLKRSSSSSQEAVAVSGRDGRVLWTLTGKDDAGRPMPFSSYRPRQILGPSSDLDGDGTPDLVWELPAAGNLRTRGIRERLDLKAVSGRDGSTIWSRPTVPGWLPGRVMDQAVVDLDGDGRAELAMVVSEEKLPIGIKDLDPSRWLHSVVVLDARDGRFRWRTPVEDAEERTNIAWFRPGFLDLDGDRRTDVVVECHRIPRDGPKTREYVVLSGATGRVAGRIPAGSAFAAPSEQGLNGSYHSSLAVDLDGDGVGELAVAEILTDTPDPKAGRVRLRVRDIRTNADRWIWESPPIKRPEAVELLGVRRPRAEGNPGTDLVLGVAQFAEREWFWLDGKGKLIGRREEAEKAPGFAGDFDRDGDEELLIRWRGAWHLVRDGFKTIVRTLPEGVRREDKAPSLLISPDGSRTILEDGSGNLFDLRSGSQLGVSRPEFESGYTQVILPDDPSEAPLVMVRESGGSSGVAQIFPILPGPGGAPLRAASRPADPRDAADRRLIFPPPWAVWLPNQPAIWEEILRAAVLSLGLMAPPAFLVWVYRNRRAGRKAGVLVLMLLVGVCALVVWEVRLLMDWVASDDVILSHRVQKWGPVPTALAALGVGIPSVCLGIRLGAHMIRGRFDRFFAWIAVVAACGAMIGFAVLRRNPLPPGCRYEWTQLENLAGFGLVVAGAVSLLASGCAFVDRTVKRLRTPSGAL